MKHFLKTSSLFALAMAVTCVLQTDVTAATKNAKKISAKLIDKSCVSENGLYFEGKKGTAFDNDPTTTYHFGKQITPHGDCIDYFDGYIFATWYEGDMTNRKLRLSRKRIEDKEWKTIEFDEALVGYLRDSTIGDSHNVAAVSISPADHKIHIVYDIHSFFNNSGKGGSPGTYFKYKVSKVENATTVPDAEWNKSLFLPTANELESSNIYDRSTYPEFDRVGDDKMILKLRRGGTGRGDNTLYSYVDGAWLSTSVKFNNGRRENQNDMRNDTDIHNFRYSLYGGFKSLNGKIYTCFSRRDFIKTNKGYKNNYGLYFASTDNITTMADGWKNLAGKSFDLPINTPEDVDLKIADPCPKDGLMTVYPIWTVTANDAKHIQTVVEGKAIHYYTAPGGTELMESVIPYVSSSEIFSIGDQVILAGLKKGYPTILATKEGTNDWVELYSRKDTKYRLARVEQHEGKLFMYLMVEGSGQKQPLHMLVFDFVN